MERIGRRLEGVVAFLVSWLRPVTVATVLGHLRETSAYPGNLPAVLVDSVSAPEYPRWTVYMGLDPIC